MCCFLFQTNGSFRWKPFIRLKQSVVCLGLWQSGKQQVVSQYKKDLFKSFVVHSNSIYNRHPSQPQPTSHNTRRWLIEYGRCYISQPKVLDHLFEKTFSKLKSFSSTTRPGDDVFFSKICFPSLWNPTWWSKKPLLILTWKGNLIFLIS